jgi:protein tyrosine/serine phosphatase
MMVTMERTNYRWMSRPPGVRRASQGFHFGLALIAASGCSALSTRTFQVDLPNLHQVEQDFYRGAQPTAEGFRQLRTMGVKTVVSLRTEDVDTQEAERTTVESLGMRWVHIPMRMYWKPSDKQVLRFLAVVMDPQQRPVFVHCRKGQNRTGLLVAIYRVVAQGWPPKQAFSEGRSLGLVSWNPFTRHFIFHRTRTRYLPSIQEVAVRER